MERVDQSGEESSFAFPCDAVTALTTPHPGIQQVPHRVAEHVQTVNGNSQGKAGPESQPWRLLHVSAPFPAEHTSPLRNRGWQTVSEEAQSGHTQDHPPDVDAKYDDYDRHNIGQDVPDKRSHFGTANCPRRQKVVILFNADNGASDYS